jgi:Ca-activated chloride channel family protein
MLAIALIIVGIARPQHIKVKSHIDDLDKEVKSLDVVLAMDISSSMLAEDLPPNRLEAARNAATDFINKRPNDKIGLVVFSKEFYTQCPLTTDHATLIQKLNEVKSGILEDGTAIGDGLGTAINRIKDSKAKNKSIVLLTDGKNNRGSIAPLDAGAMAKELNIRVYTIGVGKEGEAPYPLKDRFGNTHMVSIPVDIDEDLLKDIAELTGGQYFRAKDSEQLLGIYSEIDKLENTRIEKKKLKIWQKEVREEFIYFVLAALALLLIEFFIRKMYLRSIPN